MWQEARNKDTSLETYVRPNIEGEITQEVIAPYSIHVL
jgi:hypothetical protein